MGSLLKIYLTQSLLLRPPATSQVVALGLPGFDKPVIDTDLQLVAA